MRVQAGAQEGVVLETAHGPAITGTIDCVRESGAVPNIRSCGGTPRTELALALNGRAASAGVKLAAALAQLSTTGVHVVR